MMNANTLERWRPNLLIYVNCALAIVMLGSAFSWGIALLIARCCRRESAGKAALAGMMLFVVVFCCRCGDALRLRCLLSAACY